MPESLLSAPATGYSPRLQMTLRVGGRDFDIAESGPDFVALRDAADVEAAEACIITDIDGEVDEVMVGLADGIRADRDEQPIIRRKRRA
ncbi:MAG: hypothetical protein AAGD32_17175 [Planctomycetota bacterium]